MGCRAVVAFALAVLLWVGTAFARTPEVAVFFNAPPVADLTGAPPRDEGARAFVEGLRERGWEDGKNVKIHWRSAEDRYERRAAIIEEMVRLRPDVLVLSGNYAIAEALRRTQSIPIVASTMIYAVDNGFVKSIARPGRNVTGITLDTVAGTDTFSAPHGKRLVLLKQLAPQVTRVAELLEGVETREDPDYPGAREAGVSVFQQNVQSPAHIEAAIDEAVRRGANGLIVADVGPFYRQENRKRVYRAAERHRLPAIYKFQGSSDTGGLMTFSSDNAGRQRRSAYFVDRILRGAKPAEIPVELESKYEQVINLRAAKALGLTVPDSLRAAADRIIE